MRRILAMAGFTLLMLGGTMFAQQYKNPNLPVEERAADLCRRLTLEEKVAKCFTGYSQTGHSSVRMVE